MFLPIGLVMVGVAIPAFLQYRATSQAEQAARELMDDANASVAAAIQKTSPQEGPHLESDICLLMDLDEDGVQDISALVSNPPAKRVHPTSVSGANGDVLWQGEALPEGSKYSLKCAGERSMVLSDKEDFSLRIIPLHNPKAEARHVLDDSLDAYGVGDKCIRIRTRAKTKLGFSLTDGAAAECDTKLNGNKRFETTQHGILGTRHMRPMQRSADGHTFVLSTKHPGTRFLKVAAKKGKKELWKVPLRFVPVGGENIGRYAMVAMPGAVVVFGSDRKDDHSVYAVGLNADSGTERFATPLPKYSFLNKQLYYNGRFVVVGAGTVLAIDPADGKIAWTLH